MRDYDLISHLFDSEKKEHLVNSKLRGLSPEKLSLLETILSRRTCRNYSLDPIDKKIVNKMIEYSLHAPSACNEQRWFLKNITDKKVISELVLRGSASFLKNCNNCLIVCYDSRGDNHHWKDHIQSGASFITVFQLVAHAYGIGSCWVNHLPNKNELKKFLKIPKSKDPIGLISFGYYKNKSRWVPRKIDVNKALDENFEKTNPYDLRNNIIRIILRKIYYLTPSIIRKKLKKFKKKFEKKFYYELEK